MWMDPTAEELFLLNRLHTIEFSICNSSATNHSLADRSKIGPSQYVNTNHASPTSTTAGLDCTSHFLLFSLRSALPTGNAVAQRGTQACVSFSS